MVTDAQLPSHLSVRRIEGLLTALFACDRPVHRTILLMSTGAAELAQVAKDSSLRMQDALPDIQAGTMNKVDLISLLNDTAAALEKIFLERTKSADFEDEVLDEAKVPGDVHAWISATFTRKASIPQNPRRRLRSLVNAVRAGLVFDRIFRRLSLVSEMIVPPNALFFLKDHINDWSFDVFSFHNLCEQHSLKCLGFELLHNLNLVVRYRIDPTVLENFLLRMEDGYGKHGNPYHNQIHATDVLKTCHYFVVKTRMIKWLTDLEVFALLLAAIMHDFEHTGTTNNFHVMTQSPLALTYNDRAVLEQFHISECFRLMQDPDMNILAALTKEEFTEFRSLAVDMIFATDMSAHLSQVQTMKETLVVPENLRKINILAYLLHSADISHPTKSWELHDHWTTDLVEEFFRQGDHERALGLNCSPLCDRHSTMIPQSQIGKLEC